MAFFVSLLVYLLIIITLLAVRATQRPFSMSWTVAGLGALVFLASVVIWKLQLPFETTLPDWWNHSLVSVPYSVMIGDSQWILALGLASFLVAVIFTAPIRSDLLQIPASLIATYGVVGLSFAGIFAANTATLFIVWALLDLVEVVNLIRISSTKEDTQEAIRNFGFHLFAIGVGIAAVTIWGGNNTATKISDLNGNTYLILLFASAIRLGILPLRISLRSEPKGQAGFSTSIRVSTAIASIAFTARVMAADANSQWTSIFLVFILLSGMAAAFAWSATKSGVGQQQYLIIAVGAMVIFNAATNNPLGAVAWALLLATAGGAFFLFTGKNRQLSAMMGIIPIFMVGVPFTATSTVYLSATPLPWLLFPMYAITHVSTVVGFYRHLFALPTDDLKDQPVWAQTVYPAGLLIGPAILLLAGFWGWQGGATIGLWWASILILAIILALGAIAWKLKEAFLDFLRIKADPLTEAISMFAAIFRSISEPLNSMATSLILTTTAVFEGEGGMLWIGLFIVLIILAARMM